MKRKSVEKLESGCDLTQDDMQDVLSHNLAPRISPTAARLYGYIERCSDDLASLACGEKMTFEQMKMIAKAAARLSAEDEEGEEVEAMMLAGLDGLSAVVENGHDSSSEILRHLHSLMLGTFHLVSREAILKMEGEAARNASAFRNNYGKSLAKGKALEIATELWLADSDREIRIGEMASLVYGELVTLGYGDQLPKRPERLREWVALVAPKYAKQPGAPKK